MHLLESVQKLQCKISLPSGKDGRYDAPVTWLEVASLEPPNYSSNTVLDAGLRSGVQGPPVLCPSQFFCVSSQGSHSLCYAAFATFWTG